MSIKNYLHIVEKKNLILKHNKSGIYYYQLKYHEKLLSTTVLKMFFLTQIKEQSRTK